MLIGFQSFQLVLAAVMIFALLCFLLPLLRLTTYARLPRLSVFLFLVPLLGVVWLCVLAAAMSRAKQARKEP